MEFQLEIQFMTGEVDIHSNVHKIGGLEAKLNGAMMAGVKEFIPIDNKEDYEKILDKELNLN